MSPTIPAAAALALLAGSVLPSLAEPGDDPLARHRWSDRLVVALAASPTDPGLVEQRRLFASMGAGARERDLVLIEAVDGTSTGSALRRRFGGTAFRAILVGKDGGPKLVADRPLGAGDLFPLIDAMPMRQGEMRRER